MLVYAFFGGWVGYMLCARRRSEDSRERSFATCVAVVVSVLLIAMSWSTAGVREENKQQLLDYVREEAYEQGYEDAREETIKFAARWVERNVGAYAADDIRDYLS